ncbi:MAG TPA: hypothetical protein PLU25_10960, partial [Acidobacteriota bacterium]|nr:hypothetical protein [Acidobacteriota bacterium]
HLVPVARAAGAVVACDLQDVHDPDEPYRRDFVRGADILFASAAHHDDPVASHPENARCDELARAAIAAMEREEGGGATTEIPDDPS